MERKADPIRTGLRHKEERISIRLMEYVQGTKVWHNVGSRERKAYR